MEIINHTLGFWVGLIAGIFILLHVPSCNKHWAEKLKPVSGVLKRYHNETLILATIFAVVHVVLSIIGIATGVWI